MTLEELPELTWFRFVDGPKGRFHKRKKGGGVYEERTGNIRFLGPWHRNLKVEEG